MDGVLIVNKPKGYTSHDIVNIIKKQLHTSKVGHAGTLDPNATGVLPILIGKATKISKYLIEHNKTYIAELKLGEKSTTGDLEGEIIERKVVPNIEIEQVQRILQSFIGKQKQTPPIYSSIKTNGKKAYEYAREGKTVILPPRDIEIMDITFVKFEKDIICFEVKCSKGTYIRVLCEDIAERLGTIGLMNNLIRTRVDKFDIEKSLTIEQIKNNERLPLISIEEIFKNKPYIKLNENKNKLFLNGVKLAVDKKDGLYRVYNSHLFLGLGIVDKAMLKRDIII